MKKSILFVLLTFTATFLLAQPYTYYFEGNFTAASGGPTLTEVLSCNATNGAFTNQPITTSNGTCGSTSQPVFAFNEGGGISFPNNNNIGGSYTIDIFLNLMPFRVINALLIFRMVLQIKVYIL